MGALESLQQDETLPSPGSSNHPGQCPICIFWEWEDSTAELQPARCCSTSSTSESCYSTCSATESCCCSTSSATEVRRGPTSARGKSAVPSPTFVSGRFAGTFFRPNRKLHHPGKNPLPAENPDDVKFVEILTEPPVRAEAPRSSVVTSAPVNAAI